MKVISVGSFVTDESLQELRDRPIVVLTGTLEEIRAVGPLVYQEVRLEPTGAKKPFKRPPATPPRPLPPPRKE